MAAETRFGGRALADQKSMTLFCGERETSRMNEIRVNIKYVRDRWGEHVEYKKLKERVRQSVLPKVQKAETRELVEKLLTGFNDRADIDYKRPVEDLADPETTERLAAIELYCSQDGYNVIFSLMNSALRNPSASPDLLLTAATLVELLTIELYNLRMSNIGDARYANYQGVTYRGIGVTADLAQAYRRLADEEDLSKRHFSVPLGFMSSSTDRKVMEHFAREEPTLEPLEMTIHIHGLDHQLLQRYQQKYRSSVVTSICAMPVAQISQFAEKEILLRGPSFHVISMYTTQELGRNVHRLEVVMLNSNRDHGSEHGSDEGEKQIQRQFFLQVVLASRYEICAQLARKHSIGDAEEYAKLARIARQRIDQADPNALTVPEGPLTDPNRPYAQSRATWLGCSFFHSYPRHYANLRQIWQNTISTGCWNDILKLLQGDYNWRRAEWFNVARLRDNEQEKLQPDNGYTLLHMFASREPPPETEFEERSAWNHVLQELARDGAWRTLRTFDDSAKTAYEIAEENHRMELIDLLRPRFYHQIAENVLQELEVKFYKVMREHAGTYLDKHDFRMPQLSVLMELDKPEMWIPIPHMYGGFLIVLQVDVLHVTLFKRAFGATRHEELTFCLSANVDPV